MRVVIPALAPSISCYSDYSSDLIAEEYNWFLHPQKIALFIYKL